MAKLIKAGLKDYENAEIIVESSNGQRDIFIYQYHNADKSVNAEVHELLSYASYLGQQRVLTEAELKTLKEKMIAAKKYKVSEIRGDKKLPVAANQNTAVRAINNSENSNDGKKISGWKYVLAGTILGGGLAALTALGLNGCGDRHNVPEETIEQNYDSVEDAVLNVSVEDVEKIAADANEYLNDELGLNIPQKSINATVFIMNQENGLDAEETRQLIESGFIASDPSDVFPATLAATSTINRANAMTVENPDAPVISYSIFTANEDDKKLCDAFATDIKENQETCATLNDLYAQIKDADNKKNKELSDELNNQFEEVKAPVISNWESYKNYGIVTDVQTELPTTQKTSSIAGQWVSLQQIQPYSAAAGLARVPQKEIDFYNGVGTNSTVVFVDFSSMYNLTVKNLGDAMNREFAKCEPEVTTTPVASPKTGQDYDLSAEVQAFVDQQMAQYDELQESTAKTR